MVLTDSRSGTFDVTDDVIWSYQQLRQIKATWLDQKFVLPFNRPLNYKHGFDCVTYLSFFGRSLLIAFDQKTKHTHTHRHTKEGCFNFINQFDVPIGFQAHFVRESNRMQTFRFPMEAKFCPWRRRRGQRGTCRALPKIRGKYFSGNHVKFGNFVRKISGKYHTNSSTLLIFFLHNFREKMYCP